MEGHAVVGVHPVLPGPVVALGATTRQNAHTAHPQDNALEETLIPQSETLESNV